MKKSDLIYKYAWTAYGGDNPKITGEPDSTQLNRNEGYEILYFIKKCMEKWDLKQISSGKKIEEMIKNHVPSDIRKQSDIKSWIAENWKKVTI